MLLLKAGDCDETNEAARNMRSWRHWSLVQLQNEQKSLLKFHFILVKTTPNKMLIAAGS